MGLWSKPSNDHSFHARASSLPRPLSKHPRHSLVLAMPLPVALPQPNGSPPLAALTGLLPRRAHPLAAEASSRPPLPNPSSSGGAPFSRPLPAHLLIVFFFFWRSGLLLAPPRLACSLSSLLGVGGTGGVATVTLGGPGSLVVTPTTSLPGTAGLVAATLRLLSQARWAGGCDPPRCLAAWQRPIGLRSQRTISIARIA